MGKVCRFDGKLSVVSISLGLIAALYFVGYTVQSIFNETCGIFIIDMLKAEYIKTGLIFVVFNLTAVVFPAVVIFILLSKIPLSEKDTSANKFIQRIDGFFEFKIAGFSAIAYFFSILFMLLFAVYEEIDKDVANFFPFSFRQFFLFYLSIMMIMMLLWSYVRVFGYVGREYPIPKYKKIKKWVDCLGLFITTAFLIALYLHFHSLINNIVKESREYFTIMAIALSSALYAVVRIKEEKSKKIKVGVCIAATITLFLFLLLLIYTYTFSVYQIIPKNRGGMYPLVMHRIILHNDSTEELKRTIAEIGKGEWLFKVAESKSNYYFISPFYVRKGFDIRNTNVLEIGKREVKALQMKRNELRLQPSETE